MSTTARNLDRLRDVLDAYGGEPERWPVAERATLEALVEQSADARRLRDDARQLDAVLDALPAAAPSVGLEERIVAAALAASDTRTAHPVSSLDEARARRDTATRHRPRWLAAALPLAAAAAFAAWLATGRPAEQPAQVAVVPVGVTPVDVMPEDETVVNEVALTALGVYETPGDELLEISGLDDVYAASPWDGCTAGDLGCVETDTLPLEPVSRDDNETQQVRLLA